jgi:hypothetical protein
MAWRNDFEENVSGGVCLGTVVRNHTSAAVAGMSISLPTQRLRGDVLITLKEHLLTAAKRLSAELGYSGTHERPSDSAEAASRDAPVAAEPVWPEDQTAR